MKALNKLPSSRTWSFPPRPNIRWIEPDANNPDYVFAAIEVGALLQGHDGGKTWINRSDRGPYDTHTLVTHSKALRRLYSAAGDGYFERDQPMEGLKYSYLYGLAVDSGNPQVVLVSASIGPSRAYSTENAESFVYRKDNDDKKWRAVTKGLPEPSGTTITIFASNPNVSGAFYAVNNHGLFVSIDSRSSWKKLDTSWPGEYPPQTPWSIALTEK